MLNLILFQKRAIFAPTKNKYNMANTKLRISEVCKENGLTIAELADKLGIKPSSMSQAIYLNSFSVSRLGEIADVLGVTIPELFEDYKAAIDKELSNILSKPWINGNNKLHLTIDKD